LSKFNLNLSYKNILILKHSLRDRIKKDKGDYEVLKHLGDNKLTEEGKKFIKDHEEHIMCMEALDEEIKCTGYRHGRNIFGSKYN
jgi:hypothetical protein